MTPRDFASFFLRQFYIWHQAAATSIADKSSEETFINSLFRPDQCDQIGRFLKVVSNKKQPKKIGDFLGFFEKDNCRFIH